MYKLSVFSKQDIKNRIRSMRKAGADIPPFNLACLIASSALLTHRDKAGHDYMFHALRVSLNRTNSDDKHIIGILHDVIEDSDWTLDDLQEAGFSERIIAGVDGVTSRKGEAYFDFIVRCARNPDSLDIKLTDLQDNLNQSRNNFLVTEHDRDRLNKYILSYNYLVDIKKGLPPGTPFADWMRRQKPELQNWALLRKHSTAGGAGGPAPAPCGPS